MLTSHYAPAFHAVRCRAAEEGKPVAPVAPIAPASFYCPISMDLMTDPVMVDTGHTYDRSCIERWLQQGNRTCPVTGMRLRHLELMPNHALRNAIQVRELAAAWRSYLIFLASAAWRGRCSFSLPRRRMQWHSHMAIACDAESCWHCAAQEWATANNIKLAASVPAPSRPMRVDDEPRHILQVSGVGSMHLSECRSHLLCLAAAAAAFGSSA